MTALSSSTLPAWRARCSPTTHRVDRPRHVADSPYAPLPTLIAAARRIFQHEPLPAVRRALSTAFHDAVELLGRLAESASGGGRLLAFMAGVPGSGKTLAGLTLVYERAARMSAATFLSGNGPLVEVLRDALQSKAFVRDLHAFIKTYGLSDGCRTST